MAAKLAQMDHSKASSTSTSTPPKTLAFTDVDMESLPGGKESSGSTGPQFHKSGRPRLGFIGPQGAQVKAELEKLAQKAQQKEKGKQPAYQVGAVESESP